MAGQCIPANPDVSGIGVRIAIYAQNFLCFAPVVAHLWDGKVTADELKGVKDQSIGMLAIAFAILISTVIQATTFVEGQLLTNFHAAVILDLSWMNNTSTWIWFLLYAHHRSKADKKPIPATWSEWRKVLLSPFDKLFDGRDEQGDNENHTGEESGEGRGQTSDSARTKQLVEPSKMLPPFFHRLSLLVSQAPVLALGSIHLSLMAAIGIWLWSHPDQFGKTIVCDPSLAIAGGTVPFSSTALKVCSLLIYSLLLVPGVNLIPPFLFFLSLHILYNHYRKPDVSMLSPRAPDRTSCVSNTLGGIFPALFFRRRPRSSDVEAQHDTKPSAHAPIFSSTTYPAQSEAQVGNNNNPPQAQPHFQSTPTPEVHTAFLVIGLQCLVVINILFLVDVELTLSRNKHFQLDGEGSWGFGQVLALLLLVVPLRDFATSIVDIRRKLREAAEMKRAAQRRFEQHLREAIEGDTLEGYNFPDLIARGADPNTRLQGSKYGTLFQFAGHKGNGSLVRYLLDKGVDDDSEGTTFQTAAQDNHFAIAFLLLEHRKKWDAVKWDMARQTAIRRLVEFLKDPYSGVCLTAITMLPRLGARAEWREGIRSEIPGIVESLKDMDRNVRQAAIEVLSKLGAQAEWKADIRTALPIIVKCLNDKEGIVRRAAIQGLSTLGAQAEWKEDIRTALPVIVECLNDKDETVRQAAIKGLLTLGAQVELKDSIQTAIPGIVKCLRDEDGSVRQAATEGLSRLGARTEWREDIRTAFPIIVECLDDEDNRVRQAAVEGLSRLGAQAEWQEDIRTAISVIVECLKDEDKEVRQAAIKGLSTLGAQAELKYSMQTAIPGIVKCLKDGDTSVRQAATKGLSTLGARAELKEDIRKALPGIVKDKDRFVRMAAIAILSGLGAQAEWREDIRTAIQDIAECMQDWYWIVRYIAIEVLVTLGAQAEWREDIRTALPGIVECLKSSESIVREAAVEGLSRLGAQAEWQEDIRMALPDIVKCLKDQYSSVCQAAIEGLSTLGAQAEWQEDIRTAIPGIVECLEGGKWYIRQAAIEGLSRLGAQAQLWGDIQKAIPGIVECLEHERGQLCLAAIEGLSKLAPDGDIAISLFIGWIGNAELKDKPDNFDHSLQDLAYLLVDTNSDSLDVDHARRD